MHRSIHNNHCPFYTTGIPHQPGVWITVTVRARVLLRQVIFNHFCRSWAEACSNHCTALSSGRTPRTPSRCYCLPCVPCACVSQEAEERHRQALWADEGTNGASFMEEDEQDDGGGGGGNEDLLGLPAWRLVLRRLVDHNKFQVREQPCTRNTVRTHVVEHVCYIRRQADAVREMGKHTTAVICFVYVHRAPKKNQQKEKYHDLYHLVKTQPVRSTEKKKKKT